MKKVIKNNLFLFGYVKKYAPAYIPLIFISAFFQMLASVLNVVGIKYIIEALEKADVLFCVALIFLYFLLNVIVKIYSQWTHYYFALLSQQVSIGMTLERISASQRLDFQCFDIPEFYDEYSRALRSGEQQVSSLVGTCIALVSNIATLISVTIIITTYSIWFLPIVLLDTFFSYVVISKQQKMTYDFTHTNTRIFRMEEYYKNLCFSPSVQKEDRLFHTIDCMKKKYKETSKKSFSIQKKHLRKYNSWGGFQVFSSVLLLTITMLIAALLVGEKQLTIGEFASSVSGVQSMTGQLLSLVIQFPKIVQNARYADDYKKIVNYEPIIERKCISDSKLNVEDLSISKVCAIEFRNVSFKYPLTEQWVLYDLSFSIREYEKIAIVGENGAGKTTIAKLLLRLYDPTEGIILINGVDIKQIPIDTLRSYFSSIFQDYNLYCVSVEENIWFDQIKSSKAVLQKVGLDEKIGDEENLHRMLTRQFEAEGIVLSGGEGQRLCIARSLAKEAPVLLMDEPSSSLDPIAESEIVQVLLDETKKKTTVIITHRLSMCTRVDRILYLKEGHIIENGSHESLLQKKGKYYRLFETQARNYHS